MWKSRSGNEIEIQLKENKVYGNNDKQEGR